MSHLTIMNALATSFKTQWTAATPIEWPNTPKLAGTDEDYVRFAIVYNPTVNAIVGGGQQLYSGTIVISCFSSVNEGYAAAITLAQTAIGYLQNKTISSVFTYAGMVSQVGKDPEDTNLFVVNAKIPFESIQ